MTKALIDRTTRVTALNAAVRTVPDDCALDAVNTRRVLTRAEAFARYVALGEVFGA